MSNPEIDCLGNKYWYNEKRIFHRLDGPAVESANGDEEWYYNGNLHRIDGPAIFRKRSGRKFWYLMEKSICCMEPTGEFDFYVDMDEIPEEMKQSLIIERLNLKNE